MKEIFRHKFRSFLLALCGIALCAPEVLNAQVAGWVPGQRPAEIAFIYHAEGRDFVFSRQGRRTVFTAASVQTGAIMMNPSELVQTGPGASVEIQLVPSGTVIKLMENTSVVFNGVDINERFAEFGLLYGSIRVVSGEARYTGINSVIVRGGGVSAQLSNGDMAVNYVQQDMLGLVLRPQFLVHNFRGNVTVFPQGMEGVNIAHFGTAQSLIVNEGETLSLEITDVHTLVERDALSDEVIDLWISHNFAGSPPVPMPNTAIGRTHQVLPPPVVLVQPRVNQNRGKNLLLGIGVGLMVGSAGFLGVANYFPRDVVVDNDLRRYNNFATGVFGVGLIFTLIGIFHNPTAPAR